MSAGKFDAIIDKVLGTALPDIGERVQIYHPCGERFRRGSVIAVGDDEVVVRWWEFGPAWARTEFYVTPLVGFWKRFERAGGWAMKPLHEIAPDRSDTLCGIGITPGARDDWYAGTREILIAGNEHRPVTCTKCLRAMEGKR